MLFIRDLSSEPLEWHSVVITFATFANNLSCYRFLVRFSQAAFHVGLEYEQLRLQDKEKE
jgi:hypothetical protein